jgi:SAM-dependent methyltransferase
MIAPTPSRRPTRPTPGSREHQLRHYEGRAARYDRLVRIPERLLFSDGREWVCRRAVGDVLELAIGTGRNLPLYPTNVSLTGVELSPAMLAVARRRAERLGRKVALHAGDAESLGFPDERFDTVVATLALCSIPDHVRAVAEARRVLRPGGRLLLLEHVRSPTRAVRTVQRLLEPIWLRVEADHLLREPLEAVAAAGLIVERCERSRLGLVERVLARKPEPTH